MTSGTTYVFVYGTLKKNCPNHYVLENNDNGKAEFICEARTKELFPLIVSTKYEIPFLLDQTGIGNVSKVIVNLLNLIIITKLFFYSIYSEKCILSMTKCSTR